MQNLKNKFFCSNFILFILFSPLRLSGLFFDSDVA